MTIKQKQVLIKLNCIKTKENIWIWKQSLQQSHYQIAVNFYLLISIFLKVQNRILYHLQSALFSVDSVSPPSIDTERIIRRTHCFKFLSLAQFNFNFHFLTQHSSVTHFFDFAVFFLKVHSSEQLSSSTAILSGHLVFSTTEILRNLRNFFITGTATHSIFSSERFNNSSLASSYCTKCFPKMSLNDFTRPSHQDLSKGR